MKRLVVEFPTGRFLMELPDPAVGTLRQLYPAALGVFMGAAVLSLVGLWDDLQPLGIQVDQMTEKPSDFSSGSIAYGVDDQGRMPGQ